MIDTATVKTSVLAAAFLSVSFAKFHVPQLHGLGRDAGSLEAVATVKYVFQSDDDFDEEV